MKVVVRPAVQQDAEAMCRVINPLNEAGDTTAHGTPLDSARMWHDVIARPSDRCLAVLQWLIRKY
jgi:hypothetical protein